MPLINVRRVWTPLEWLHVQILYSSEEKRWYIKKPRKPLKRLF
jgi:hypothetical protein